MRDTATCCERFRPIAASSVRFRPTFFRICQDYVGQKRSQQSPIGQKRSQQLRACLQVVLGVGSDTLGAYIVHRNVPFSA